MYYITFGKAGKIYSISLHFYVQTFHSYGWQGRTSKKLDLFAWGDFHARLRFSRSTIPEEKWGTTRSLQISPKHYYG